MSRKIDSYRAELSWCDGQNMGAIMFVEAMGDAGYAGYRARLYALIGIAETATDNEIHLRITAGFPVSSLIELYEKGGISPWVRDQIIPSRTLKIRLNKKHPLNVHESDRLFRAAHLTAMAEVTFGDFEKARRWLNKPKEQLNGKTPMEMLFTLPGTRRVEQLLFQITEGYAF